MTKLLAILLLAAMLLHGCGDPGPQADTTASTGTTSSVSSSDLLNKMVRYKNLSLEKDKVHQQDKAGRFLRLEDPATQDNWADMMTLQHKDGTPIVVYLSSECEEECDQELYVYAYKGNRFVDVSAKTLPGDLEQRLLKGVKRQADTPMSLGYRLKPASGEIELVLFRVNDEQMYENMEVRGRSVGILSWNGSGYALKN